VYLHTVLATEFIHPSGSIKNFLFTSVEWMALRTYFDMQFLAIGRAGRKGISATADNLDLFILRVYFGLHLVLNYRSWRTQTGAGILCETATSCNFTGLLSGIRDGAIRLSQIEFSNHRCMVRRPFQFSGSFVDMAGYTTFCQWFTGENMVYTQTTIAYEA